MMYLALKEVGSVEAQKVAMATYFIFFIEYSKKHLWL